MNITALVCSQGRLILQIDCKRFNFFYSCHQKLFSNYRLRCTAVDEGTCVPSRVNHDCMREDFAWLWNLRVSICLKYVSIIVIYGWRPHRLVLKCSHDGYNIIFLSTVFPLLPVSTWSRIAASFYCIFDPLFYSAFSCSKLSTGSKPARCLVLSWLKVLLRYFNSLDSSMKMLIAFRKVKMPSLLVCTGMMVVGQ